MAKVHNYLENYDSFYYNIPEMQASRSATGLIYTSTSTNPPLSYEEDITRIQRMISEFSKPIKITDEAAAQLKIRLTESEKKSMNTAEQQEIDEAVREAIEKPRREAEIAKRVAAIQAIGTDDTHEVGAVMRWKRKYGKTVYAYAAIKTADEKWYVTGSQTTSAGGYTWDKLVEWMTTGENLITDLEIASGWNPVF